MSDRPSLKYRPVPDDRHKSENPFEEVLQTSQPTQPKDKQQTPAPSPQNPDDRNETRRGMMFTREQKREIFRGMVVSHLDAGFLRYSRRQQLMRYARQFGFSDFEASLLIAEAQYYAGDIEPAPSAEQMLDSLERPPTSSIPWRLTLALMVAILADLVLISWLLY